LATTIVFAACSGGTSQPPSVGEYALEMEQLLAAMQAAMSAGDAEMQSSPPSIDTVRVSIDGQLAALDDFLSGFLALEPPAALADDHARAAVAVQDLRGATKTLADIAHSVDSLAELEVAFQGAPIEAAEEASERAWEMCRQAQAAFGEGVELALEFASPWLQASATERIEINLRCFFTEA
jgi:hypothetical protein